MVFVYCPWQDDIAWTRTDGVKRFCSYCGATDHKEVKK